MQTREQVIEGLNGIHAVACGIGNDECYLNSIGIKQLQTLINDATALLRSQEPRLMTLEEIKALPDCVFLEDRDISNVHSIKTISRPALPQLVFVNSNSEECIGFRGPDGDTSLVTSRYGAEWRCWTSSPTDAQREAVKWE